MFGHAYFGKPYFGQHYFGQSSGTAVAPIVNYGRRFEYKTVRGVDEVEIEARAWLSASTVFERFLLTTFDFSAIAGNGSSTATTAFLRHFADSAKMRATAFEAGATKFRPILTIDSLQAQIAELTSQIRPARFLDIAGMEALAKVDSQTSFDGWIRQEFTDEELRQMASVLPKLH